MEMILRVRDISGRSGAGGRHRASQEIASSGVHPMPPQCAIKTEQG
jgi:hypothetical protein